MPNSIANKIKLPDSTIIEINDNRIIVSNPQSGQVLSYDSINDYWTNKTIDIHDGIILLTYNDLYYVLNHNELIPGQKYRITDYVTTTAQANTQSANHPFDLVVLATSPNTLDCQAKAVLHLGDTYFVNTDLSKWQIWYDINNDTTKYAWADSTNGKGVIYRLIDDLDNDCPYDFKNIRFNRKLTSGVYDPISGTDTWVYTFSIYQNSTIEDSSLVKTNEVHDNRQGSYTSSSKLTLNDNVFIGTGCYSNIFEDNCYSNTFGNRCHSNIFGNYYTYNTFGDDCNSNTFGYNCNTNTFDDRIISNTFGNNCSVNTFNSTCQRNTFGSNCNSNNLGSFCINNIFGNNCSNNIFENYCQSNIFGNSCNSNALGNRCYSNIFGNECTNIKFGNSSNQGGTYCRYNIIENGNQYIRLYQTSGTAGNKNQLQNVYIAQGVNNTTAWLDISTIARNLSYRTTVAKLSDGTIRIYREDEDDMLPSITNNAGKILAVNSGATGVEWITNSGGGTWGSITGTLSDQTDLQTELNNKEKKIYKQANAPSNPSDGDLWIDTDENSIILPTPTQADSGKVVMVDSNGVYILSNVINAEDQQY